MDLSKLKVDFGDHIVFNGAIDAQHTLIEGSPETVRAKTREVLSIMKPGGGYVGGASHDTIMGETPVQNVLAMFDTLRAEARILTDIHASSGCSVRRLTSFHVSRPDRSPWIPGSDHRTLMLASPWHCST